MQACMDCGRLMLFASPNPKRCPDCKRDHEELAKAPQAPKVELAIVPPKKWRGDPPVNCQICQTPFGMVFYDAATTQGWGLVCHSCFKEYGYGLGVGKGQKYSTKTLERIG